MVTFLVCRLEGDFNRFSVTHLIYSFNHISKFVPNSINWRIDKQISLYLHPIVGR